MKLGRLILILNALAVLPVLLVPIAQAKINLRPLNLLRTNGPKIHRPVKINKSAISKSRGSFANILLNPCPQYPGYNQEMVGVLISFADESLARQVRIRGEKLTYCTDRNQSNFFALPQQSSPYIFQVTLNRVNIEEKFSPTRSAIGQIYQISDRLSSISNIEIAECNATQINRIGQQRGLAKYLMSRVLENNGGCVSKESRELLHKHKVDGWREFTGVER